MWRDFEDWGEEPDGFVAWYERDRYTGPCEDGLTPFLDESAYVAERRYIGERGSLIYDTTDFLKATIYATHSEAAEAIQRHRGTGDMGRLYKIKPVLFL